MGEDKGHGGSIQEGHYQKKKHPVFFASSGKVTKEGDFSKLNAYIQFLKI